MISQPDVTVNIIPAAVEVGNSPQRTLIVGQMLSGTATAGALTKDIQNSNNENALFGESSLIAAGVRAFKRINRESRIDAIALADNGAGTAATGSVVFANNATAAGTITIYIGSKKYHKYEVVVSVGDTPTEIGDAFEALVTADTKAMVSASNTTGTVTLTANHKGSEGNDIGIAYEIDGVTATTVTLTAMNSGAGDPSLTALFDVIENQRYQTIIWPGSYDTDTLTDELQARFNVTNDVLDGVGVMGKIDTFANLKSFVTGRNQQTLIPILNRLLTGATHKGGAMLEHPYLVASQLAAIRSLRLTEDANIAQYTISTNGARDSFGGTALASFPYFNTPFPYLSLIEPGDGFSREEIEQLHDAGGSVIGNNIANTDVIAGEIVTTYKTDVAGNVDPSFKYLNYVDTASNAREYFFNNLRKRFAQSRLTEGDLVPNRAIANRQVVESYLDSLYDDLSSVDYVLTQAGEVALQFFRDNRSVTLDMVNGKVIINMQVPLVVQLRTIVATMQIAFSTES